MSQPPTDHTSGDRPPGDPPVAEETLSTRERLLQEAARLFAERGREAVSIRDIAAEAGVRHGGINYHFRSKDELYHEALMRYGPVAGRTVIREELPRGLGVGEAREAFRDVVRRLVAQELQPLDPVAAGLMRGEISRPDGPNEVLYERVIRPHLEGMADLIGQAFPELTDDRERRIAAFQLTSQCVFLRIARPVLLRLLGVEDFDDELTDVIAGRIVRTAFSGLEVPLGEEG